jgi:glutamine phosphoribosylpyrophosphate amidotransferase
MITENIFGIWNPTEKTLNGFQALHSALAKHYALLDLEISTLHNDRIQHQDSFDIPTLLSDWQKQLLSGSSIAFFRPNPIYSLDDSDAIPMFSNGRIAVACLGVIDNLSEMQEKLFSYGYGFQTQNVAKTLSYLFSRHLETGYVDLAIARNEVSPIDAMRSVMKNLKGHFALMVLVAKGKWLMVGCRDYPLVIGKDDPTVYFGTDTETLAQFSPSIFVSVSGKTKPAIFCATSSQSEIISPVPL